MVGRASLRLFRGGSELVLRALERVTGLEFLGAISEFLLAFEELLAGFSARAREVERLLRDPSCGFVLVAGPDLAQARRAEAFWERLSAEAIHLVGLVMNRVHPWPGAGAPPPDDPAERGARRSAGWRTRSRRRIRASTPPPARARSSARPARRRRWRGATRASARSSRRALPLEADALTQVPLFAEDVHALDGLARMADAIFGRLDHG